MLQFLWGHSQVTKQRLDPVAWNIVCIPHVKRFQFVITTILAQALLAKYPSNYSNSRKHLRRVGYTKNTPHYILGTKKTVLDMEVHKELPHPVSDFDFSFGNGPKTRI